MKKDVRRYQMVNGCYAPGDVDQGKVWVVENYGGDGPYWHPLAKFTTLKDASEYIIKIFMGTGLQQRLRLLRWV